MKLHDLYSQLDKDQRADLAKGAGTDTGYLWQIATQWRGKRPSLGMIQRLAAADDRLSVADLVAEFSAPPPTKEVA